MSNLELQKASLVLFKSIVRDEEISNNEIDNVLVEESLKQGILFNVNLHKYINNNKDIKDFIYQYYGKDKFNLNNTFHKSYKTVKEASEELLRFQATLHYITTYGFEELGIFDENTVYVPNEKLELPENTKSLYITYINIISKEEISKRIMNLLSSGIALNREIIDNAICIIKNIGIELCLDDIKNKEAKCILSSELGIIPSSSDEILRTLCYIATDDTSLIRSVRNFKAVKNSIRSDNTNVYNYIKLLENKIEKLSESYLRNKQLWLAFKNNVEFDKYDDEDLVEMKQRQKYINHFINRLRKLAEKNHVPMIDPVNLSNIKNINIANKFIEDNSLLNNENIFSKIKAYNYLKSKVTDNDNIYKNYRIRNGLTYSVEKESSYKKLLSMLYENIKDYINKIIKNKKVYIPKNVTYVMPTSEKKFINGIPEMSKIDFKDNFSVGIYWKNHIDKDRNAEVQTDLDLKLMSLNSIIGWDYSLKEKDTIIYTGDMTDASIQRGGAAEAMFIDKTTEDPYLVMLNNFTDKFDVEYKLIFENIEDQYKQKFIDERHTSHYGSKNRIEENFIFNVNNCMTLNSKIGKDEQSQKCIGMFYDKAFLFLNTNIGYGRSSHRSEYLDNFLKATILENKNMLTINELLLDNLVDNKNDADIDLSFENINSDTFIKLLINQDDNEN